MNESSCNWCDAALVCVCAVRLPARALLGRFLPRTRRPPKGGLLFLRHRQGAAAFATCVAAGAGGISSRASPELAKPLGNICRSARRQMRLAPVGRGLPSPALRPATRAAGAVRPVAPYCPHPAPLRSSRFAPSPFMRKMSRGAGRGGAARDLIAIRHALEQDEVWTNCAAPFVQPLARGSVPPRGKGVPATPYNPAASVRAPRFRPPVLSLIRREIA